jgi:hypothetical protein
VVLKEEVKRKREGKKEGTLWPCSGLQLSPADLWGVNCFGIYDEVVFFAKKKP